MARKSNGKMTLDKLARMVQRGFEESATKDDLRKIDERLSEDIITLRRDTESGFQAVATVLRSIKEDIKSLDYGPEVHDLRMRMDRVERKLGMKR